MVQNGNFRPRVVADIETRIDNGRVFISREADTSGIGDGGTFSLVLSNPAGSGIALLTTDPAVRVTGEAFFEKIENPTIDTAGDTVTQFNKHVAFARSPSATAEVGGTNFTGVFSGGTSRGQDVVGGQSAKQAGTIGAVNLSNRIDPGDAIQYKVESNSSSNLVSIAVTHIEEPINGV
jgi:hypothetical protein